jgi:hypothetical protein
MRSVVAVVAASILAIGTAQAGEYPYNWLVHRAQAVDDGGDDPVRPSPAPRPPVQQAPVAPPSLSPSPPSVQPPAVSPPLAEAQPDDSVEPTPPPSPRSSADTAPVFAMTGEHVAAITVGVIGGLVILDGVLGVPAAAAAFVGGLAGQWWHTTYRTPNQEYRVNHRTPLRVMQEAAGHDTSASGRWLKIAGADGAMD